VRDRNRVWLLILVTLVIALGLASRRPGAPAFVLAYAGDALWGALFFLLSALVRPRGSALSLAASAIAITESIELSELYRGEWALELRATRLGGLLLGHAFSWSDVLCVFVGAALAGLLDVIWRRAARTSAGTKPGWS
jgi:hypothetical protein